MNQMISKVKRGIRKFILRHEITTYFFSYSGEDAILQNIFNKKITNKQPGFYVDVGAYHPFNLSNTHLFYINGWRGINIDAMPGSMKLFNRHRKRDINLELAISDKAEKLVFYQYKEDSANSFSKDFINKVQTTGGADYSVKKEITIYTHTLKEVLDKHLPAAQEIDFLSVDVEGMDFRVILSNDWDKYRPKVVVVELLGQTIKDIYDNEITQFLEKLGYEVCAKTVIWKNLSSVFFIDSRYEF